MGVGKTDSGKTDLPARPSAHNCSGNINEKNAALLLAGSALLLSVVPESKADFNCDATTSDTCMMTMTKANPNWPGQGGENRRGKAGCGRTTGHGLLPYLCGVRLRIRSAVTPLPARGPSRPHYLQARPCGV